MPDALPCVLQGDSPFLRIYLFNAVVPIPYIFSTQTSSTGDQENSRLHPATYKLQVDLQEASSVAMHCTPGAGMWGTHKELDKRQGRPSLCALHAGYAAVDLERLTDSLNCQPQPATVFSRKNKTQAWEKLGAFFFYKLSVAIWMAGNLHVEKSKQNM